MRDKNLNFIQFEKSVEKFITKKSPFSKDRRTSVIDNPTLLEDYYLVIPRKFGEFRGLCILVHYIPEIALRWKLFLDLEEKLSKFDLKKQLELKLLLSSKENMLIFLYETEKYTSHEIFGNIIEAGCKAIQFLQIKRRNTKVIKTQRKRGYDDKGSLRPREKWLECYDISFTELQNEKEKKLKIHLKTYQYLDKFLRRTYYIESNKSKLS